MGHTKYWLDAAAITTAIAGLFDWLPKVASLLSVIWLCIQIFEWARKKRQPTLGQQGR